MYELKSIIKNNKIRSYFNYIEKEYYFSILDVISSLEIENPKGKWQKIKKELLYESSNVLNKITKINIVNANGNKKYTDMLDVASIIRVISILTEKKAKDFINWYEKLLSEKLMRNNEKENLIELVNLIYEGYKYNDIKLKKALKEVNQVVLSYLLNNKCVENNCENLYLCVNRSVNIVNKKIEFLNVEKTINGKELLNNVNLTLRPGKIYGLVGANGSGKSTLLKIMLGLTNFKGEVYINGYNVRKEYRNAIKNVGGIVDDVALYEFMSAKENLRYFSLLYGAKEERTKVVLDLVGLDINDTKMVKQYSLGMKQRLGIAISLLKDPDILVLDEPTNGLDPKGILDLRNLLKSLNKTIIVSSHLISEIEKISADVLFINDKTVKEQDITKYRKARTFRVGNMSEASQILPKTKLLTDDEVNIYVRKLVEKNIPVYSVNETSSLEDILISMMEDK